MKFWTIRRLLCKARGHHNWRKVSKHSRSPLRICSTCRALGRAVVRRTK